MYTYAQKLKAAYERHREGRTWVKSAEAIGAAENTLREWDRNHDEEWEKACAEVIEEMRREGAGAAWRALVEQVRCKCDVAAAKEILNRVEGAVGQTLRHEGGDPEKPMRHDHTFDHLSLDELAAIARNGDGKQPTGDSGAGGDGATGSGECAAG